MAQTQQEAEDAVLTLVTTTWQTAAGTAPLFYDNQDEGRPDTPTLFGRVVVRHFGSSRESLGDTGENTALFRRRGSVFVQIFVPQGQGSRGARDIAEPMIQAFEDADATLGVRLTNADINELGADGAYWQVNVVADISYDRIS